MGLSDLVPQIVRQSDGSYKTIMVNPGSNSFEQRNFVIAVKKDLQQLLIDIQEAFNKDLALDQYVYLNRRIEFSKELIKLI